MICISSETYKNNTKKRGDPLHKSFHIHTCKPGHKYPTEHGLTEIYKILINKQIPPMCQLILHQATQNAFLQT